MVTDFRGLAKTRYFAKHAGQKVLGLVPHGFAIQEGIKRTLGHWRGRAPSGVYRRRVKTEVERFNAHGIPPPQVVVEQGTGWSGSDLVIFYLGGAKRILTYDIRPWLRVELLRQAAREIADAPEICRWNGISQRSLEQRIRSLRRWLDLPLHSILQRMGVEYRVATDFKFADVADGTVDLFFSYSVLQRMRLSDLRDIVDQSRRVLKEGGVSCHRIHTHDFHRITNKRIPHFYYLTINESLWNTMTSTYLNYQNRLRVPEFVELFRTGFDVETDNVMYWDEDIPYVATHLSSKYPNLTPREIATWQADIFARKRTVVQAAAHACV